MKRTIFALVTALALLLGATACTQAPHSPNGLLTLEPQGAGLLLRYREVPVLEIAAVGMTTEHRGTKPALQRIAANGPVETDYRMLTGKKEHCTNRANEYIFHYADSAGHPLQLIVRLYDDGVAFRYRLQELQDEMLTGEQTTYRIPAGVRRWMMPWNDAYEGIFDPRSSGAEAPQRRWAYPALLEPADGLFALITESDIDRGHSASSLWNEAEDPDAYRVTPDRNELHFNGEYCSPWRVVVVGPAPTLVASTLVTDLAPPCRLTETDWIRPGTVSWIYWAYNHGSSDYGRICQYVDLAVALGLPYVLIDAEWDEMRQGRSIEDAVAYAREHGIRPLIWYSSSVGWIDGAPGPKFRLNDPEAREREFAWCERLGIAGVKIDFFDGDSQPTMDYCIDLLEAAARHRLLVNFHGATLPRGWQRTYPHLLTTEAVYGAEWYNNLPVLTERAAAHNATLPFTRNVVGSMDYTPCTFSDSQHPHTTTHAHELALTVLFESGLQHLADRPESYLAQPQEVQTFLGSLPTVWEETQLIAGYPGETAVLARRRDARWYIAGINGTDAPRELPLGRCDGISDEMPVRLYLDGAEPQTWELCRLTVAQLPETIRGLPRGGFVCVIGE